MTYKHLGLTEWPFRIVPEPEFCDFLADRRSLRTDIENLLVALSNRPTSDIQLLWSWYGAGKTHTVFYLANQCRQRHTNLLPLYVELPREVKGFSDLYRVTVARLEPSVIIDSFLEASTRPSAKSIGARTLDPDLHNALTQAALGERPVQVLLQQWLLGNSLAASSYRELGVGGRINTTEKCSSILADLITMLAPRGTKGEPQRRVIWIIDEVQRVEEIAASAQRSVLSGLVGVFNKCPTGLTIVLSYTGTPREKQLPDWIPPDLADRIGLERPMLLPPLSSDDAMLFIRDLLAHFRVPGTTYDNEYFPFRRDAIEALVLALSRRESLKPRTIMEGLDAALRTLEPRFRSGELTEIDTVCIRESLAKFSLDWERDSKARKRA